MVGVGDDKFLVAVGLRRSELAWAAEGAAVSRDFSDFPVL
jgi:hypothetical protein